MKKKLIRKILTAIAVAGSTLAGSINSYAQSTGSTTPADRPVSSGTTSNVTTTTTAPTQPISRPPSTPSEPVKTEPGVVTPLPGQANSGSIAPITPIDPSTRPIIPGDRPLPGATTPSSPGNGSTRLPPATGTGAVYVGTPAQLTPLPAGSVIPPSSTAANSGVRVVAGDLVRPLPVIVTADTPPSGTPTPVTTLVQRFDAQRAQELAARDAMLTQLRTASPAEREALIAEMQAGTQRQAAEQREAAREVRRELRTMREERKGK